VPVRPLPFGLPGAVSPADAPRAGGGYETSARREILAGSRRWRFSVSSRRTSCNSRARACPSFVRKYPAPPAELILDGLGRDAYRVEWAAVVQPEAVELGRASGYPSLTLVTCFPFRYVGTNEELRPLARGLTHLMITDLGKLERLTLLERERVQALVDELALTDAGRVDPGTGARSGRMLRAARVVQGSVQDVAGKTDVRLDAAVVDATNSNVVATGTASDQLQQLFALEKQVLFRLLDQMGISVTPAERRALSERPTADLQAFLAFSRGLEAEDRGDYQAAEAGYSAAVARDPNFRQARERRTAAQRAAQASLVTPRVLAGLAPDGGLGDVGPETAPPPTEPEIGRTTVLRTGVLTTVPSSGATITGRVGTGPVSRQPATRPQLPETLGTDTPTNPGLQGTIIIIVTRP